MLGVPEIGGPQGQHFRPQGPVIVGQGPQFAAPAIPASGGAAPSAGWSCGSVSTAACGAVNAYGGIEQEAQLGFVGSGRGSYMQETTYKYVGMGCGELEYVTPPAKTNYTLVICSASVLGLTALAGLLWYLFGGSVLVTTTKEPYDCNSGLSSAAFGWSVAKQQYCCARYMKGCPTTAAPMPVYTTSSGYDCDAGFSNYELGWSDSKKVYCCSHEGRACPTVKPIVITPAPTTNPFTPTPTATPTAPSTTSSPYDCTVGYDEWPNQWVKGWGGTKKLYCCRTAQRGCASQLPKPSGIAQSDVPALPDPGPYDCLAGYRNCYPCLLKHWSAQKLDWCCKEKNLGCKSNTKMHM